MFLRQHLSSEGVCIFWQLVYEFESEQEAKDLLVEITDLATNEVIGRKKLYAATAGSIDIAPYLRRRAIATLPENIIGCGIVEPS